MRVEKCGGKGKVKSFKEEVASSVKCRRKVKDTDEF